MTAAAAWQWTPIAHCESYDVEVGGNILRLLLRIRWTLIGTHGGERELVNWLEETAVQLVCNATPIMWGHGEISKRASSARVCGNHIIQNYSDTFLIRFPVGHFLEYQPLMSQRALPQATREPRVGDLYRHNC